MWMIDLVLDLATVLVVGAGVILAVCAWMFTGPRSRIQE